MKYRCTHSDQLAFVFPSHLAPFFFRSFTISLSSPYTAQSSAVKPNWSDRQTQRYIGINEVSACAAVGTR